MMFDKRSARIMGKVFSGLGPGGAGASGGVENDGGAGPGGMGAGTGGDMGRGAGSDSNFKADISTSPKDLFGVLKDLFGGFKLGSALGLPGALIGGVFGAIKGFKDMSKDQKSAVISAVKSQFPGMTDDAAEAYIGVIADRVKTPNDLTTKDFSDVATIKEGPDGGKDWVVNTQESQEQNGTENGDTETTQTTGTENSADSFWQEYQNEFFSDENNVKDLIQDHADHLKTAAEKRNTTLSDAERTQAALLGDLGVEATDSNTKYQSILDDLMGQANYNTGRFKPIMYTAGGNTISKVPNSALREIAAIQGIGREGFDASGISRGERAGYGQTGYNNSQGTADSIYETAGVTSPSVGRLKYLDALMGNTDLEERKRQFDKELLYKKDALAKGYATNNRQLDQNEPGLLDYLGTGLDVANGLFGSNGLMDGWL